jgi:hypothetical protein
VIQTKCPACGREFEFADFLAGVTAVCKNCGHRIPVPAPGSERPPGRAAIQTAPAVTSPPPTPIASARLPGAAPTGNRSLDSMPPDWTIAQARALPPDVGAAEGVRHLVAQGLSPEAATDLVEKILEERIRQQNESLAQAERRPRLHRALSGFVGAACVVLAYGFFGTWSACMTGVKLLLPLACIWFPEGMGGFAGRFSLSGPLTGLVIRWCGWLLLALIALRVLWLGIALTTALTSGRPVPPALPE